MSINFYSVANHLEENGWQLLSTEYKNLKSPLKMKCPNGHEVEDSYEHWRKHPFCSVCLMEKTKRMPCEKIPQKKEGVYRVLGLDAATHVSGYSVFDNNELVGYGTFKTKTSLTSVERINEFKGWLKQTVESLKPDFIRIENIQLQSYSGKANFSESRYSVEVFQTLANLQGVILDCLYELGISYDLIYASSWRKICDVIWIKGRENKKQATQKKVNDWYGLDCTQDEADAICIGRSVLLEGKSRHMWGEQL